MSSPFESGRASSEAECRHGRVSLDSSGYNSELDMRREEGVVQAMLQSLGRNGRNWRARSLKQEGGGGGDSIPLMKPTRLSNASNRHLPYREIRRCRRTYVTGVVRRLIFAAPFLVLMFFGVIHILHAALGRAFFLWNSAPHEALFPDWGKPGQPGDGLANYPTDATRDVLPIPCHSHNDYWRRVPLFDGLHAGCTGTEADVWLFDEELYVGHNVASLTKNRTFQNLYVNPLRDLLDRMNPKSEFGHVSGHGVFDVDPSQTLLLLVDFKTDGAETWPYVLKQLEPLREKDYLSYYEDGKLHRRAVTVVGTGNTPFDRVQHSEPRREIFFDAPLAKMWEQPPNPTRPSDPMHVRDNELSYGKAMAVDSNADGGDYQGGQGSTGLPNLTSEEAMRLFNTTNSYYASTSFSQSIGFVWRGHLSPRQMELLRGQIRGAKRLGLKARYWDTPSWPVALRNHIWHVLVKEGADVLNVDDLHAASVGQWNAGLHPWW